MSTAHPYLPNASASVGPPLWLLLELTYRCPLQCVFCYNPVDFAAVDNELTTQEWIRVLREARALGSVQLGLSGGEVLVQRSVEAITAEAHPLKRKMALNSATRLLVMTVIGLTIAFIFRPQGLGVVFGMALFQVVLEIATALPVMKKIKAGAADEGLDGEATQQ